MSHWKSLFANDIFEVDYDRLVAEPEPIVRELLSFLGLQWESQCLEFHRAENRVKTASIWQVRQPLYKTSSGRWQHYESELNDLVSAFNQ